MPISRDTETASGHNGRPVTTRRWPYGRPNTAESFNGYTETSSYTDIEPEDGLTIDCDCCALRNTDACDDCVVSFLLGA